MSLESGEQQKSERSVPLTASQQAAAAKGSGPDKARSADAKSTASAKPSRPDAGSSAKVENKGSAPAVGAKVSSKSGEGKDKSSVAAETVASPKPDKGASKGDKAAEKGDKSADKAAAKEEKAAAKALAKEEKAAAKARAKAEKEERKKAAKAERSRVASGGIKDLIVLHVEKVVLAGAALAALALVYLSWGELSLPSNQTPQHLNQTLDAIEARVKKLTFEGKVNEFIIPPYDSKIGASTVAIKWSPASLPDWHAPIVKPHKRIQPEIFAPLQVIAKPGDGFILQNQRLRPAPAAAAQGPGAQPGMPRAGVGPAGAPGAGAGAGAPRAGAAGGAGAGAGAAGAGAAGAGAAGAGAPAGGGDGGLLLGGGAPPAPAAVANGAPVPVPNALLEALGGIAPPPVNPKDPVFAEARRWVCLVALLPIAQQKAEYDRQFAYAIEHGKYDTDPIYCAVRLVRYTVIPGSSEFDPKETLDLSFKDQFQRDQKEQKLWVMIAPEVVPPRYVRIDTANLYDDQRKIGMGVITQPLAPLMLQRWESWATHPQLVQIPVVETKEEAPAEPVAPEPAPEAAPPPMGQPVQDAFGNPIAPAPAPAAARPAAAPRRVVARSRPKESENVEYQLVRIFDFSVQPGVQYRYKLQLMLRNPNFEMAPMNLQDPKVATSKLLNSPFSELSNVVAVPQGQSVLADTVVRPEPPAAPAAPMGGRPPAAPLDSMASVVVKILNFDAAQLTFAALNLRRGAMVAGNAAQIIVDPIARTVARSDKSEVKTDLVLADFHGGEPLDEGLEAPAEVLFIDAAGQLVVQNSVNDELWVTAVREFKGLLDAVEAANQPAAGNAAAVGTGGDVNALHKAADPARGPAKGGAKGGGKPPKTPKDMNK